jgi:lipopolysaccharide/colanic/teichoic acid biosynthesis glycosyltransferase
MLKFRKMYDHAGGPGLTSAGDVRLTRVGRWLARTKLDELPQLWHVVRGEMALVGPRPESPDFVRHHADAYRRITSWKPGIFGLSQVAFVQEARILDPSDPRRHYLDQIMPQKVALDLLYLDQWRLWLDVSILFWSLISVLLAYPVAVHRSTAAMNRRRR